MSTYEILPESDANLDITITDGETIVIDITPASFTLPGGDVASVNGYTGVVQLDTDDIPEGESNLYYTDERVDARIALIDYPVDSVNGQTGDVLLTTTEVNEGDNLYYTDERVDTFLTDGSVTSVNFGGNTSLSWNADEGTLEFPVNGEVTLQVGQENIIHVKNLSGATLNNGAVVRVTGASGSKLTVDLANNTSEALSADTIAVMTQSLGNNAVGYATTEGLVRGLNTSAYTEGAVLWLDGLGVFTQTKPLTPLHLVQVGYVVRSHATEGSIFVSIKNGWELDELHDVLITAPTAGESIVWDGVKWVNQNITVDLTGYATEAYVDAAIPTNISELTNDSGFITSYTESDPVFSASVAAGITTQNVIDWSSAFAWGDHALAGYLTSETDSQTLSFANPNLSISNGNTVDLSGLTPDLTGYATEEYVNSQLSGITVPATTDDLLEGTVNLYYSDTLVGNYLTANNYATTADIPTDVSAFNNDVGYITSYTETDPVFTASPASGIAAGDITNWNTAYGWGDHALAGYLTGYTETDPVFTSSVAYNITQTDIDNWNNPPAGYTDADVDTHLNTSSALTDQVLTWNGSDYAWADQSGGGASALDDLTDVAIDTGLLGDGDILRYNGTAMEWQNTNLGISTTPVLTQINSSITKNMFYGFTINNIGDYDNPSFHVVLTDPNNDETVYSTVYARPTLSPTQTRNAMANTAVIDVISGDATIILPDIAGDYTLSVSVQDFGDLASEVATLNFTAAAPVFTGGSYKYVRIQSTREMPSGGTTASIMYSTSPLPSNAYSYINDLSYYSGAGGTGSEAPNVNMTSDSTNDPTTGLQWISSSSSNFSGSYLPWKAFDSSTTTAWWSSEGGLGQGSWMQLYYPNAYTVNSFGIYMSNYSYLVLGFKILGSNTGAFAGEEDILYEVDGFLPDAGNAIQTIIG